MRKCYRLAAVVQRIAGTPDDARADYVMRVDDAGTERGIRFRPAGQARLTTQQLLRDKAAFAATPEACRRSLAG